MDLGGAWRAAPADEALRRSFPGPEYDDGGWEPVQVPGHWRSTPAFAGLDGPILYRRRFTAPSPGSGRRAWLTFDGVFYDGDVWLDGTYIGATEGYFFPHTFEVTGALMAHEEHVVAVEVGCTPPSDRTAKRSLTGVFQHWDCLDPDWNPGGIWCPVHLDETGPVRLSTVTVLCNEATPERASLDIRAVLDADAATDAVMRVTVDGRSTASSSTHHTLAGGANRIRLQVPIERPALWWPHALGDQPLHDVTVTVLVPANGTRVPADGTRVRANGTRVRANGTGVAPNGTGSERQDGDDTGEHEASDTRRLRTGIRQVRMKNFIVTVNGERLFVKGTNQGPSRMALADATPGDLERDVVLAREAGLDLLRIHAHVSRPELYDAADRHGVLLWQDLPLQWGYARTVRRQAVRQAREAVDLLGHHPSVAVWCGHNEPLAVDAQPGPLRFAALQALPTWNKTVLDTSLSRPRASRSVAARRRPLGHPARPDLQWDRHAPVLRLVPRRGA